MKPAIKLRPCPHDVNVLLAKEREYIPNMGTKKGDFVWCDDCHQWVGFEFDGDGKHE